jgi:hypothetical protein
MFILDDGCTGGANVARDEVLFVNGTKCSGDITLADGGSIPIRSHAHVPFIGKTLECDVHSNLINVQKLLRDHGLHTSSDAASKRIYHHSAIHRWPWIQHYTGGSAPSGRHATEML